MAKTIIDLKGNEIHADKFVGEVSVTVDPADIDIPAVTVAGVTVGPGNLIEVLEDLVTLINTKADS